ncbi:MAG TPA: HAD family hydrolase, partial [Candidatus Angelobacter sp.]|nr:HAD family hydrolase [Candidatus Angelobacter sp.]
MKPVLVFDLNGTLTDTSALDPFFHALFGSRDRCHQWYTQLIELAMTCAATGEFIPFATLADAALHMLAGRYHVTLTGQHASELRDGVRNLPPFPDVAPGLEQLQAAGYRLAVMTNSAPATAEYTLQRAAVAHRF